MDLDEGLQPLIESDWQLKGVLVAHNYKEFEHAAQQRRATTAIGKMMFKLGAELWF